MSPQPAASPPPAARLDEQEARGLDELWSDEVRPVTARRLLLGAVDAFAACGYHATTTRDIAARAGLSPAGVYVHFPSKEELLFQISLLGHRRSVRVVSAAAAAVQEPAARLGAIIGAITAWHASHHTTARVINYEISALSEPHRAEISALRRQIDALVRATLADGVERGVFDAPDIPGTALAMLSLTMDVARWYRSSGPRSPEELGAFYADLALRMVAPRAHL